MFLSRLFFGSLLLPGLMRVMPIARASGGAQETASAHLIVADCPLDRFTKAMVDPENNSSLLYRLIKHNEQVLTHVCRERLFAPLFFRQEHGKKHFTVLECAIAADDTNFIHMVRKAMRAQGQTDVEREFCNQTIEYALEKDRELVLRSALSGDPNKDWAVELTEWVRNSLCDFTDAQIANYYAMLGEKKRQDLAFARAVQGSWSEQDCKDSPILLPSIKCLVRSYLHPSDLLRPEKLDDCIVQAIKNDDAQEINRLRLLGHSLKGIPCVPQDTHDASQALPQQARTVSVALGPQDSFDTMARDALELAAKWDKKNAFRMLMKHLPYRKGSQKKLGRLAVDPKIMEELSAHIKKRNEMLVYHASITAIGSIINNLLSGANPNVEYHSKTLLHHGVCSGQSVNIRVLLEHGADENARDVHGQTPLHVAIAQNKRECFNILLRAGALIDAQDYQGITPLHVAAIYGRLEYVKTLLAKGANRNARDDQGKTPRDYAHDPKMRKTLKKR